METYGPQGWWPAQSATEIMLGAVLTQHTAWTQVQRALERFRGSLHPAAIRAMTDETLKNWIRPAGFQEQKAKRIRDLLEWLLRYGDDWDRIRRLPLERARIELLAIKGIGEETAHCILNYALDQPCFVVDAYTVRLMRRLGWNFPGREGALRVRMESALPRDASLLQELHALIVAHAKHHCRKVPRCEGCPIRDCPYPESMQNQKRTRH